MSLKSQARKNGRSTLRQMVNDLAASRTAKGQSPAIILRSVDLLSQTLDAKKKR